MSELDEATYPNIEKHPLRNSEHIGYDSTGSAWRIRKLGLKKGHYKANSVHGIGYKHGGKLSDMSEFLRKTDKDGNTYDHMGRFDTKKLAEGNFKVHATYTTNKDGGIAAVSHVIRNAKNRKHAKELATKKHAHKYDEYEINKVSNLKEEEMVNEESYKDFEYAEKQRDKAHTPYFASDTPHHKILTDHGFKHDSKTSDNYYDIYHHPKSNTAVGVSRMKEHRGSWWHSQMEHTPEMGYQGGDIAVGKNHHDLKQHLSTPPSWVKTNKLKEETMLNRTKEVIDSLYEGNNDIRDTLDEIISAKAVEVLEAKKIEIAQSIFNEGKTYKDRNDKWDYDSGNMKKKKKDDEYRSQRRKEKEAELDDLDEDKKKVCEEPLDELSVKLLKRYRRRGEDDSLYHELSQSGPYKKREQREKGMKLAARKIRGSARVLGQGVNEEHDDEKEDKQLVKSMVKKDCLQKEEQLDELNDKTYGSYIKKAALDVDGHAYRSGVNNERKNNGKPPISVDMKKSFNRHLGIRRAVKRLTKEEEQLDETVIGHYHSKKHLAASVGKPFRGYDPSMFGDSAIKPHGQFVMSNRPSITRVKTPEGKQAREFFAQVHLDHEGKIAKVK